MNLEFLGEDLVTKVKSDGFVEKRGYTYNVPLFVTDDSIDYDLYVSFPDKKEYILSTISWILILSAVFIFIIIVVFCQCTLSIDQAKADIIDQDGFYQ